MNTHAFYTQNTNTFDSAWNTPCIGTLTSSGKMYRNSGVLVLNAAGWTSGGTKGLIFSSGYDAPIKKILHHQKE
jgi:hypothetical protein